MQKFLLVLACLAHHTHARRVGKSNDDEDNTRTIAALLNAHNPSAAVMSPGGQFTTQQPAVVQGKSLKTWSYRSSIVDSVQVVLSTDGRPLDADVQLWQGPDNTPCKMRVYSEDGSTRPFSAVIATPDTAAGENTVAVRNVGEIVFPLNAYVVANDVDLPFSDFRDTSAIVQGGGSIRTYEFNSRVESVEIMLKTDGRPLNARVELLEGPNNIKQVIELYTEDGLERPFFAIIDTKGMGNVVRVVNTAPIEFPMFASVEPHNVNGRMRLIDDVIGGVDKGLRHVSGYNRDRTSRKHLSWGSGYNRDRTSRKHLSSGSGYNRDRTSRKHSSWGTNFRSKRHGRADTDVWKGSSRRDTNIWTGAARSAVVLAALAAVADAGEGRVRRWN